MRSPILLACVVALLLAPSCLEVAASECELCGRQDGTHGDFRSNPPWAHDPDLLTRLGELFTQRGYVLFQPHRRGHGSSTDQGPWSGDLLNREQQENGPEARARLVVKVNEEQLQDQRAALDYLRSLAVVDAERTAVAGCSFDGIQTVLAAEQDLGLRAGVDFA